MVVLLETHDFDSLLSTQRCDIMLFKLARCMLSSTQEMVTCPYMNCGTWWEGRERPSPIKCFTMPPVCMAPSSTGNVNGVVCCLWLTHLGLPTIFFTHSAADFQWPELAELICPDNPYSRSARAKAVIENPALAD